MQESSAGTFGTVKALIWLQMHYQLFGSEANLSCFDESLSRMVDVFARQVLNEESHIQCEELVQDVSKGAGIDIEGDQSTKKENGMECTSWTFV